MGGEGGWQVAEQRKNAFHLLPPKLVTVSSEVFLFHANNTCTCMQLTLVKVYHMSTWLV